jgi:hypothetical protein
MAAVYELGYFYPSTDEDAVDIQMILDLYGLIPPPAEQAQNKGE